MYVCMFTSVCVQVCIYVSVSADNGSQCMFEDTETQGNSKQCDSGGSEPNITRICLQRYVSCLCIVSHVKVIVTCFVWQ